MSEDDILPSKNSPNPKKFMRELNELMPYLKANDVIPKGDVTKKLVDLNGNAYQNITRKQAREMGFKSSREANKAINQKAIAQQEHERRAESIGFMVEKDIKERHPILSLIANFTGWMWVYKLVGLSWNVKGGVDEVNSVPGIACSWVNIYRWGRVKKVYRLVWEDPKSKSIIRSE